MRELWCLLDFANPGVLGAWEEFEEKHNEGQQEGFSNLHQELHPYLLRRVKKDVEKFLPKKSRANFARGPFKTPEKVLQMDFDEKFQRANKRQKWLKVEFYEHYDRAEKVCQSRVAD